MLNFAHPTNSYNSDEQLKVREAGLPSPPAASVDVDDPTTLPAGRGRWAVPPHLGFSSIIGLAHRAHYWTTDEALRHSRSNADAMLKDILILTALEDRLRPASQLSWHIEPLDETDNEQVRAAAKVQLAISKTWKLQEAFYQWNLAKWYGKYGLSMLYEWDSYQPDLMRCRGWSPINGDSITARYAFREFGQLVNALYEGPTDSYSLGRCHWWTPEEMESVVIHTHRPRQPDWFDGTSSGQLVGCGLRHGCYWVWYFRANLLALMMDYAERLSSGIWKGKYDNSNPQSRADLEQAVAQYKAKSLLSLPMKPDGTLVCDLEIMEVGGASAAILKDKLNYLDRLLRSYILGRPVPEGNIGGDEIGLLEGSISATTKADAVSLAEDLTTGWLPTLYKYNCPSVPAGRFVFDVDHPDADKLLKYSQIIMGMGWSVNLDHLAEVCGLQPAALNSTVGTKIQSLNPTAVEDVPQNIPIAGNTAPPQSQQPIASSTPTQQTLQ